MVLVFVDFSNSDGEEVLINSVLSRRILSYTEGVVTPSGVVELMLEQNTELETERAVGDGNRARGSEAKDVFWIIEIL